MRRIQRLLCLVLMASMSPVLAHTPQKGTITCESLNDEYHHCFADTQGQANLKQQLSRKDCRKGKSWAVDSTGIWVDRGCRAEFEYGREQGGSHTGRNVAIAAGVASAIALAVIISSRKDKQTYDKLSEDDKQIYNKGWDRGTADSKADLRSDYTRYADDYRGKSETAFKAGYKEGYQHIENKQGSER